MFLKKFLVTKELTSKKNQEFLANWQVRHRVSSMAFPHSNSRAELGVKQVKRMITDNTSEFGSLDVDRFHRAIMSYRNTVDPTTKHQVLTSLSCVWQTGTRWPTYPPWQI